MLGPQHKQFNIPFSILISCILVGILGFSPIFFASIPVGIYTYSLCDIDAQHVPRRWKMLKTLWISLIVSIFIVSLVATGYFGYNIFTQKMNYNDVIQYFGLSLGVVLFYILCFKYNSSSKGKWLTAHRGFTHRLIVVIIPMLVFWQLNSLIPNSNDKQIILIKTAQVFLAGLSTGILGHQLADLECARGIKGWLWPLFPETTISIGKAISADPKDPRKPHKSSIIYTNISCVIFIILTIIILIKFGDNFIKLLPIQIRELINVK